VSALVHNAAEEAQNEEEDQHVLSSWEAVDFGNFQMSLEDQATELVDMQENRLNQRKDIAQKTKDFRSLPECTPTSTELIKMYQKHLDDVTTQAKYSANAFLTAFKILRELPDPSYSLARAFQRLSALQARLKMLEEREESLANALRASREKAKGAEELRAEREQFRENVQLDGDARLEAERVGAQEKLVSAQAHFEEELAKVQTQLDLALEEVERLKSAELEAKEQNAPHGSRARANSKELQSAFREGYEGAERSLSARLDEAARLAEESSTRYQTQLDELRLTISHQMEQIGDLKAELSGRPDPGAFEKLKTQLAVMTKLQSDNPQLEEDDKRSFDKLDGLEAWLLHTNQRLVADLNRTKQELLDAKTVAVAQQCDSAATATGLLMTSTAVSSTQDDDQKSNISAIRSQRDRLRAVLEKRDLEIERLQNNVDEKDQKVRRLEDDAEKLRQRVRFLQSYKVSEKSTLLPAANASSDPESGTAMLGRGVGHEFRGFWEADRTKSQSLADNLRSLLMSGRRNPRSLMMVYLVIVHLWLVFTLFRSCGYPQEI
jgi:homeobox protein cut-like